MVLCGDIGPGSAAHHCVLRSVRGTRAELDAHLYPLAMTECVVDGITFQFASSLETQLRILAAYPPELCLVASPPNERGRREGRVPAGTHGPLCEGCATRGCTAAYR